MSSRAAPKGEAPHTIVQRLSLRRCTAGHPSPESNRSVPGAFAPENLLSQSAAPKGGALHCNVQRLGLRRCTICCFHIQSDFYVL